MFASILHYTLIETKRINHRGSHFRKRKLIDGVSIAQPPLDFAVFVFEKLKNEKIGGIENVAETQMIRAGTQNEQGRKC